MWIETKTFVLGCVCVFGKNICVYVCCVSCIWSSIQHDAIKRTYFVRPKGRQYIFFTF